MTRATDPTPPWTPVPLPATASPSWRGYLDGMHHHIAVRTTHLADDVARNRPAWSRALGQPPTTTTEHQQWLRHAGVVAAYRDQHTVTNDNADRPLGPYIEADRPGHRAYWHAAAAVVAARQLTEPTYSLRPRTARTGTGDRDQSIAHRVAVDTYLGLPDPARTAVARTLVGRLGNLWHGHDSDLDTGVTQPVYAPRLIRALTARGYLGNPEPAATTDTATVNSGRAHDEPGNSHTRNGAGQPLRTVRHRRSRTEHDPTTTTTAQQPGAETRPHQQGPVLQPPPQQHTRQNGPQHRR